MYPVWGFPPPSMQWPLSEPYCLSHLHPVTAPRWSPCFYPLPSHLFSKWQPERSFKNVTQTLTLLCSDPTRLPTSLQKRQVLTWYCPPGWMRSPLICSHLLCFCLVSPTPATLASAILHSLQLQGLCTCPSVSSVGMCCLQMSLNERAPPSSTAVWPELLI